MLPTGRSSSPHLSTQDSLHNISYASCIAIRSGPLLHRYCALSRQPYQSASRPRYGGPVHPHYAIPINAFAPRLALASEERERAARVETGCPLLEVVNAAGDRATRFNYDLPPGSLFLARASSSPNRTRASTTAASFSACVANLSRLVLACALLPADSHARAAFIV